MHDDEDDSLHEDLYAVLNLSRGASITDIKAAFKRLSLIFHPDKHSDPEKRREASVLFDKIKTAHDILTNPTKKALYDNYGMAALKNYGMELVSREKSVAEILAEYEAIREIKEETRMLKLTQPSTEFEVQLDCSELFKQIEYKNSDTDHSSNFFDICPTVNKMKLSQGVNLLQSKNDTMQISGEVSGSMGKEYDGNFGLSWRRISNYFLRTWYELNFIFYPGGRAVNDLSISRMLTDKLRASVGINGDMTLNDTLFLSIGWRTGLHWFISNNVDGNIAISDRSVDTTMKYTSDDGKHISKAIVGLSMKQRYVNISYIYSCSNGSTKLRTSAHLSDVGTLLSYGATQQVSDFTRLTGKIVFGNVLGVNLFISINRGTQKYKLPISLSDDVNPIAIIYGTVVPLLFYLAVDRLIFQPWRKKTEQDAEEEKSTKHAESASRRVNEAKSAQNLMAEKANRIRDQESVKNGLVVVQAVYGKLCGGGDVKNEEIRNNEDSIDVTIPLQVMVENSKLILPPCASYERSNLEGFYDPCPHQEKVLYIRYLFHDKEHEMTAKDSDKIALPLEKHLINS